MDRRVEVLEEAVLSIKMVGVQTGAKLFASRADLIEKAPPVSVYVVDLTRAVACVSGEEMDRIVLALRVPIPGAVVVSQNLEQMFREHAWRMALHGITRRVFTDSRLAMGWALKQRERIAPR